MQQKFDQLNLKASLKKNLINTPRSYFAKCSFKTDSQEMMYCVEIIFNLTQDFNRICVIKVIWKFQLHDMLWDSQIERLKAHRLGSFFFV